MRAALPKHSRTQSTHPPESGHGTVRQNQQYEHTRHTRKGAPFMLASTLQFSNHHTTPPQAPTPQGTGPGRRERNTTPDKGPGGPGTQQHAPHHNHPTTQAGTALTLFQPARDTTRPASQAVKHPIIGAPRAPTKLRRKEVIQPHLPVRLPCYDLVPITSLTLDGSPQQYWSGHRLRVLPTFMT